ncbi:MAG TPA: hypothetical protein VFI68_02495 [Anaerolineales bacterium]|nr:hypothetical protein [Anaerolineales bacterium]
MSINDPNKIRPKPDQGGFLGILRELTLIAVAVGAFGSLAYMFRAGQDSPRLLLFLFTFWILSPFAALLWANMLSKCWSVLTRVTLFCVTLILALGSLAIYGDLVHIKPEGSPNAFLFVIVPPLSLAFMTIVVAMAAFISGRLQHRDG